VFSTLYIKKLLLLFFIVCFSTTHSQDGVDGYTDKERELQQKEEEV
jgi:hypothetical protein